MLELDRPKCIECKVNVTEKLKNGYRDLCKSCRPGGRNYAKTAYRVHKKDHCENPDCPLAGWKYESYLLDVDHIDGNKENNDPSNLKTLCCVCHRVKTHTSRDFVNIKYREAA